MDCLVRAKDDHIEQKAFDNVKEKIPKYQQSQTQPIAFNVSECSFRRTILHHIILADDTRINDSTDFCKYEE